MSLLSRLFSDGIRDSEPKQSMQVAFRRGNRMWGALRAEAGWQNDKNDREAQSEGKMTQ